MGQPKDQMQKLQESHQPGLEFTHLADQAGKAFSQEVQQDWQKATKWMKAHPNETKELEVAALVVGSAVLFAIKDKKDSEAALALGTRRLQNLQVVEEKAVYGSTGAERHVFGNVEFGDKTKTATWLDPSSAQARRLLEKGEGLGGFFHK